MNVLGIAGSIRASSYNKALLHAAADLCPEGMTITPYDIGSLPLYNADLEQAGLPDAVTRFRQAIIDAHALVITTPEYNHSVPGVLKNAVDWASRPPSGCALDGKVIAVLGASPSITGTVRAQVHLRDALAHANTFVLPRPEVFVANVKEKFVDGVLVDETTKHFVGLLMQRLHEVADRMTAAITEE